MNHRFTKEDFDNFKDFCDTYANLEYDNEFFLVCQAVQNTPAGMAKDKFCKILTYLLCYIRECFYTLITDLIQMPEYVEVRINMTSLFLVYPSKAPGKLGRGKFVWNHIPVYIQKMVNEIYGEQLASAVNDTLSTLTARGHYIEQFDKKMLMERLVKTQNTSIYTFSYNDNQLVATKDIHVVNHQKAIIQAELKKVLNPKQVVLDALTTIVSRTVSIANTLWGDSDKINPDVADCHPKFNNVVHVQDFDNPKTLSQSDTIYTCPSVTAYERTFVYMNIGSIRYLEDDKVTNFGVEKLIYSKGMEVTTVITDVYDGIRKSTLKDLGHVYTDPEFLAVVNHLVNTFLPGHELDVKYMSGFCEICSGKRFPIHHTIEFMK